MKEDITYVVPLPGTFWMSKRWPQGWGRYCLHIRQEFSPVRGGRLRQSRLCLSPEWRLCRSLKSGLLDKGYEVSSLERVSWSGGSVYSNANYVHLEEEHVLPIAFVKTSFTSHNISQNLTGMANNQFSACLWVQIQWDPECSFNKGHSTCLGFNADLY